MGEGVINSQIRRLRFENGDHQKPGGRIHDVGDGQLPRQLELSGRADDLRVHDLLQRRAPERRAGVERQGQVLVQACDIGEIAPDQ